MNGNDIVKPSLYSPGQLILSLELSGQALPMDLALQEILEQKVIRTAIKARESVNGNLIKNKCEGYLQDFVVQELYAKQIYNSLRRYREEGRLINLLMFETDPTHTKVVDAWMIQAGKILHIRTSSTPTRDIALTSQQLARSEVEAKIAEIAEGGQVTTTFSILGDLSHDLSLIDRAQDVFHQMRYPTETA